MKTLVNHPGKQVKVSVDFDGRCTVNLPGGRQIEGQFTEEETEVIAFRVNQITEGAVFFEPSPTDFFALHKSDVETLEKQAEALNLLREAFQKEKADNDTLLKAGETVVDRLTTCEADLAEARANLKDAREAVSLLQEKNEMLEQVIARSLSETHTKDGNPRDSNPETESERDTRPPEGDSEPPSPPPDLTVHNERPTEDMPLL